MLIRGFLEFELVESSNSNENFEDENFDIIVYILNNKYIYSRENVPVSDRLRYIKSIDDLYIGRSKSVDVIYRI